MRKVNWGKKTFAAVMAVVTMFSTFDFVTYRSLHAAETEETASCSLNVENELAVTYDGKPFEFEGDIFTNPSLVEEYEVTYSEITNDGETEPTTTAPTDAGKYKVYISAKIKGENSPLNWSLPLTIKKADLIVKRDDQTKVFTGEKIEYDRVIEGVNGEVIPNKNVTVFYYGEHFETIKECRNVGTYQVFIVVKGLKNYNNYYCKTSDLPKLIITPYAPLLTINREYKPFYNGKERPFNTYTVKGVEGEPLNINNMNIEYYLDEACTIPAVGDDPHTAPSAFRSRCYVKLKYVGEEGGNYCDSNEEISRMVIKYEPKIVMPDAIVNYTGEKQIYPWDDSMIIRGDDRDNGLHLSVGYYKEYKNSNDNVPTGPEDGAKNPLGAPSKPGVYIVKVQYHESMNYNPKAFYGKLIIKDDEN
ncbi:MAG: hypothetical protein E7254_00080 [Lachnospiraceae bacterium]|nr:hypothetical protein [Lachnospiraceae bacterium]